MVNGMSKELYSKDTIIRIMKFVESHNPMINAKEMIKEVNNTLSVTPSDYIPEEVETKTDTGDTFIREMMEYYASLSRKLIRACESPNKIEYAVNQYVKLYKLLEE